MMPGPLRRLFERLGWPGVAGVLGLLLALLLLLAFTLPLARQRDALRDEVAALHDRLRLGDTGRPPRDDSAAAQLRRFHAGFPTVPTAPDWLNEINQAARRSGIVLSAGEYRLDPPDAAPLRRYAVVLPVRGSYGQIRAFVESALAAVPSAALEDIEMRREAAADTVLDAKLRMTLYFRDGQ
jgi:hypothetical protein